MLSAYDLMFDQNCRTRVKTIPPIKRHVIWVHMMIIHNPTFTFSWVTMTNLRALKLSKRLILWRVLWRIRWIGILWYRCWSFRYKCSFFFCIGENWLLHTGVHKCTSITKIALFLMIQRRYWNTLLRSIETLPRLIIWMSGQLMFCCFGSGRHCFRVHEGAMVQWWRHGLCGRIRLLVRRIIATHVALDWEFGRKISISWKQGKIIYGKIYYRAILWNCCTRSIVWQQSLTLWVRWQFEGLGLVFENRFRSTVQLHIRRCFGRRIRWDAVPFIWFTCKWTEFAMKCWSKEHMPERVSSPFKYQISVDWLAW